MVMFVPENGVVTGNGAGPRTELTEPNDYFTFLRYPPYVLRDTSLASRPHSVHWIGEGR